MFEDDFGILSLCVPLTPDRAISDEAQDPDHPQKNTNAASWNVDDKRGSDRENMFRGLTDHESDGTSLPGTERHERIMNTPHERSTAVLGLLGMLAMVLTVVLTVVFMVFGVMRLRLLSLTLDSFIEGSANERYGQDTDDTILYLLPAFRRGMRMDFNEGEA